MSSGDAAERWHLSEDGCDYDYDAYGSMEDAVEAGRRKYGGDFYVGRDISWRPQVDEEKIIDDVRDQAYDFAGEYADDWLLSVADKDIEKLREMLQEAFDLWMFETGNEPDFFMVDRTAHVIDGTVFHGWV